MIRGLLALALAACLPAKPAVPGATDIAVTSVAIVPQLGEQLAVDYGAVYPKLATDHELNPFRVAEDRERIAAYLLGIGYFDAEVAAAELTYAPDRKHAAVTWHVHEGARYAIAAVELVGAPPAYEAALAALVPFHAGDPIDLERYRGVRNTLADRLRREGYGRARGYSRTFVDRDAKTVVWRYFIEPGVPTRVGAIRVEGNRRVPANAIVAATGLAPGERYSSETKRRAELALLDSGTFASASVISEADDPGPPPMHDDGGVLAPEQVDAQGNFMARTLDPSLDVRIAVVEAPARQLRAEVGVEADPSRVDAYAGARVVLRDLFGPMHQLVLEGNVGRGWFLDADDPVHAMYGGALVRYEHASFRFTGRWRDTLYPSALLRELTVGPGFRAVVRPELIVEGDAQYRFGHALGLPALDPMSVAALALPSGTTSHGLELVASVLADHRDDKVEPTSGWLLATRASYQIGDHRWLAVTGDARGYLPLNPAWSVAARATAGEVTLGAGGIPLGPRLFGGGVDAMRGFARDRLSPGACRDMTARCDALVGGRSLVEASLEVRWLAPHAFAGATMFVDAGGAGAAANPLASGLSVATGAGLRLRTWYLPVSFDLAYRLLDGNRAGLAWGRVLGFVHIGEAF